MLLYWIRDVLEIKVPSFDFILREFRHGRLICDVVAAATKSKVGGVHPKPKGANSMYIALFRFWPPIFRGNLFRILLSKAHQRPYRPRKNEIFAPAVTRQLRVVRVPSTRRKRPDEHRDIGGVTGVLWDEGDGERDAEDSEE